MSTIRIMMRECLRNCLGKSHFGKAENFSRFDLPLSQHGQPIQTMKKLICILASAALLGACEQKETVVTPAASPAPAEKKVENKTTIVNPAPAVEKKETTTTTTSPSP